MDLDKLRMSKQINYRIPKHDESHMEDLVATLKDLTSGEATNIQTLEFLGMLWSAVQADDLQYKPRTRAERAYMILLENALDKVLAPSKLGKDGEYVSMEMFNRTKHLLLALYFHNLNDDLVRSINIGELRTCGITRPQSED